MSKKLESNVRHDEILKAALSIAVSDGMEGVTRDHIARLAGVASGTVSLHMGTMANMKRTIMRHAVKNELLPVIAQGLAMGSPYARSAPDELKQRALATLA